MRATTHLSRTACLGVVVAAHAVLSAAAQDTCELKLQSAVGERRLVGIETTIDATITATDLEEKKTARSIFTRKQESFAEEMVVVDDRKAPIQVRLNCLSSTVEERTAGDTAGGLHPSSLQGRVVTVTREGEGWTVIPLGGGSLDADAAASLARWLDLPLLLKAGTVKVGDSWTVKNAERLASLGLGKETGTPELRCTLGRILPGTPLRAEVSVSVRMDKGKEGEESYLKGQLVGLLVLDLAAGKPQSFSLSGSFRAGHAVLDANGTPIGRIDIQARQVQLKMSFEAPAAK